MANPSPLGVLFKKTVQFQGKLFTSTFLQAAVAGPILGIDFLSAVVPLVALTSTRAGFSVDAADVEVGFPRVQLMWRGRPPEGAADVER